MDLPILVVVRLMQVILREPKKEQIGDFILFVGCKVFFESEFVGFEVYSVL